MSVKFYQRTIDSNKIAALGARSFKAKFFIGHANDFTIDATRKVAMRNWPCYGTNASFFMTQKVGAAYMTALHIVNNKTIEEATNNKNYVEGGGINLNDMNNTTSALDFMYYTGTNVGIKAKTGAWSKTNNAGIPSIQWAVGGFNLLLDSGSTSQTAWETKFGSYYSNIGSANIPYKNNVARTLIGYRKSNNDIVLATVFGVSSNYASGANYYECYLFMKYLGCSMALALDGSTCTKIRYHENSADKYIDQGRETWCRIRLTDAAADTCDWTGT